MNADELFKIITEMTKEGRSQAKVDDVYKRAFKINTDYSLESFINDLSSLIDNKKSVKYSEIEDAILLTSYGYKKLKNETNL